jgi:predicted secreted protein
MTWFTGALVFVVIWWCVFFLVLPFGLRTPDEAAIEPEPGHATSAPLNPRLGLKFAITTAISAVLWGVYYYVADSGMLDLRSLR